MNSEATRPGFTDDCTPLSAQLAVSDPMLDNSPPGDRRKLQGEYLVTWRDRPFAGEGYETIGRAVGADEIFADGFESGNTIAWSQVVP